ncbi:TIGR03943 family protein [Streptomyces sp. PSKA54]|uniref:TIGR03943 family protein n=1 Tax=Streptomyces himalayensis subsp. aureolus TaxID=2758039 RepID=A0A7W2HHR0_9ACTN|nr:TIGR03943 family protein [Streptomyces himalayensis]MBA4864272.1 TIGR03943 family protein [Streptomyces himalayensis subsp. aureolus]
MKRPAQVLLLALTGIGLLHASLFSDLYLRYVKEGLRPLLIASGVLLLLLGLAGAALDHKRDGHHEGAHGHDHSTAPRIAWLLSLPALSLLFYAPPALGAYTASRANDKAVKEQKQFAPLPATSPLPMTLTDFTTRVQQDREQGIKGRGIQMTGFATPAKEGDGWYLTRIIFTCCAADSQPVKVRMYGTPTPPADAWVEVTGTWHPRGTLGTKTAEAALDVRRTTRISPPVNAYTDNLPLTPS